MVVVMHDLPTKNIEMDRDMWQDGLNLTSLSPLTYNPKCSYPSHKVSSK